MDDSKFKRIEEKLDKIDGKLQDIDKTLIVQEVNLREHMRRTELNEIAVEKLSDSLKPIQKHVSQLEGALKLVGVIGILAGIASGIWKIIS